MVNVVGVGSTDSVFTVGSWDVLEEYADCNDCNDAINISNQYMRQPVTIKSRVGERIVSTIINSEASVNVVSSQFLKSVVPNYAFYMTKYAGGNVKAATGSDLAIEGIAHVDCIVKKQVFTLRALIANNVPHPLIWGSEGLHQHSRVIDY